MDDSLKYITIRTYICLYLIVFDSFLPHFQNQVLETSIARFLLLLLLFTKLKKLNISAIIKSIILIFQ